MAEPEDDIGSSEPDMMPGPGAEKSYGQSSNNLTRPANKSDGSKVKTDGALKLLGAGEPYPVDGD